MADFDSLDPETRCFALVGRFLQAWSAMEGALHSAIGAALAIEAVKLQILCANIRFRDKVHILATLVDVAPHLTDKERIRKSLKELGDYAGVRNMMAHDVFRPDEAKTGVEFLTVKAKGKFGQPSVIWDANRFLREGDLVAQYKVILETLMNHFLVQPLPKTNYAAALLPFLQPQDDWSVPMRRTMSPALLDSLSRQAQALPDTGPASPIQTPQTPENREE